MARAGGHQFKFFVSPIEPFNCLRLVQILSRSDGKDSFVKHFDKRLYLYENCCPDIFDDIVEVADIIRKKCCKTFKITGAVTFSWLR